VQALLIHSFLTSALNGGDFSFTLRQIYPRERALVPIESEAGWGPVEKSLILFLCQESKQDTPDIHPTSWSLTILSCCTELAQESVRWSLGGTGWATVSFSKELDNIWTKRLWRMWGRSGITTFDSRRRCVLVCSRRDKQLISTPWSVFIPKIKIVAARRMVWEGHVAWMRQFCLEKVKEDHSEELHVYGMIILKWVLNRVGQWEMDWVGWG
jgi:hypothetical protein